MQASYKVELTLKLASFIRAAIFDLELEWTMGGRGWGKGDETPARGRGGC